MGFLLGGVGCIGAWRCKVGEEGCMVGSGCISEDLVVLGQVVCG